MGFAIGLILGTLAGIFGLALCVSVKSKNIFTNADRIALDTEQLADLIYRADDISPLNCHAEFGDEDELIHCRYPNEDNGCVRCIREWLVKEVDKECKD